MAEIQRNAPANVGCNENDLRESDLFLALYRAIIEAPDLPSGLRAALQSICNFTGWAVGTAWLPSEDKVSLHSSWHGGDEALAEFTVDCQRQSFAPGVGIAGRVWESARPEWTRNLAAESVESYPLAQLAAQADLKAGFAVPIIHNEQIAGVLVFHARETRDRDDQLLELIARVSTQLGFAVQHTRLAEELRQQQRLVERRRDLLEEAVTRRTIEITLANQLLTAEMSARERIADALQLRAHQQAAVAELGRYALGGAELSALMVAVTELVTKTLEVEFCKVLELLPGGDALLLRAGAGWRAGAVGQATLTADANSQAGYTLQCREPVIVADLRTETRFSAPPLLRDHQVISGLSVIIGSAEEPFGVLGVHSAKPRQFSQEDVNFMQAMANVLFQAIDHNRVMEQVQRNANWLKQLIETTQDAVLSIDRQARIVQFNPAAERIFGYARGEIIGCKVNVLMAEPYASEHDDYIARYERTGEARAIGKIRSVTARRKDGEYFPIELSVTEIAVDQEVHYAAFIRDVSEKTNLQNQLLESERLAAVGRTAAQIGHELANPLNGMSLTIQLLEQRLSRISDNAAEQLTPTVSRLKNEIARLQKLVGQFATISRREKYDLRAARVSDLIDDIVALQAPHLALIGVALEVSLQPDLPLLMLDGDKIKQALLNLVKNAAESMPNGGVITIEGFDSKDALILEITDTGEGIPLDVDPFQPFVTTKKEGTGVGLVIVRQILTAHRGRISYRSRPGEGTIFRLELPH